MSLTDKIARQNAIYFLCPFFVLTLRGIWTINLISIRLREHGYLQKNEKIQQLANSYLSKVSPCEISNNRSIP